MNYKPLYIQLKEAIIQRVLSREYLPGEKLPSEREMAATYKVNRMTVKNAIDALVKEGYLYKIKNVGTYVTRSDNENKIAFNEDNISRNMGMSALLKLSGYTIKNTVVEKGILTGRSFFTDKLGLSNDEEIYYLYRLRSVNDESIAFEQTYLPYRHFRDIDEYDFTSVSLYDYMERSGHMPDFYDEAMTVQKVIHPIERIMSIDPNELLFVFEFVSKDKEGNIVEYTISYTRQDKVSCIYKIEE